MVLFLWLLQRYFGVDHWNKRMMDDHSIETSVWGEVPEPGSKEKGHRAEDPR
jgi:hypothetical protein